MSGYCEYVKSVQTDIVQQTLNLSRLLTLLGEPQRDMEFIHITGTNGKGSVCAFLEAAALSGGFKPGRFSSPELINKTECIRIGGKDITEAALDKLIAKVGAAADRLDEKPSPFEMLFAAALIAFKREKCSPVIIEVGMGGEGDATNVIENTKIEIITKISVDHIKYLGNSVGEIARKKAAIIKRDSTVVSAVQEKEAEEIIRRECDKKKAKLIFLPPFESLGYEEIYEKVRIGGEEVKLSLGGVAQLENAALAAKAAKIFGISEKGIINGLKSAKNPGRFEKLKDDLYFDGAHNPDGAKALAKSLERYFPGAGRNIIMGVMADKDYKKMLGYLNSDGTCFFFVDVAANPRSEKSEKLLETAAELGIAAESPGGISKALKAVGRDRLTVVCGSLYLYGEVKAALGDGGQTDFS